MSIFNSGLTPRLDLASVISGKATLADATLHCPDGGFSIVAGRSGSGLLSTLDPAALERILAALQTEAARCDVVLLDLSAGLERAVRRMSAWADRLLVLATEEPTSLTDAYAVLKLHAADRPDGNVRIVVNQATTRAAGERTFATLERACQTFLGRAQLAGDRPARRTRPGCHSPADAIAVPASERAGRRDVEAIARLL